MKTIKPLGGVVAIRKGDWCANHDSPAFQANADCWSVSWVVSISANGPSGLATRWNHRQWNHRQYFLSKVRAEEVYAGLLLGLIPDTPGDKVNFQEDE